MVDLHLRSAVLIATLLIALVAASASAAGTQRIKYRFGPLKITPGQNTIDLAPTSLRPEVPGWITRFKPDLEYADGTKPRVGVVHLHHGVWLIDGETRFAVGEEKTIVDLPDGFGYRYTPDQSWLINYMIHGLTPQRATVYITYEIDFVPDTSPEAAAMKAVQTQWLDVAGPSAYPVFDALRADGTKGRLTVPDDLDDPTLGRQSTWTVRQPTTLVSTAVHLHPGGRNGYLTVTRDGRTRRIFTSYAKYWEPAGAVSWDVAMTGSPPDWRVALQPGDIVELRVVYDVSKASWYESMGIMPIAIRVGEAEGKDPFDPSLNRKGRLTHGRLAENIDAGGRFTGLPNPARLLAAPVAREGVAIEDFVYQRGDLTQPGARGRPPVIRQGETLTFTNQDAYVQENGGIFHTITSCKLPCNRSAGIGYPLANGPVDFDSGQLGFGPRGFTAAANRVTWSTPRGLKRGTYAYFCRVHPFMRGSFRVVRR